MTISDAKMRREVSENFHRLMHYRALFGEQFVGRQAWVCLRMLGGLASEF